MCIELFIILCFPFDVCRIRGEIPYVIPDIGSFPLFTLLEICLLYLLKESTLRCINLLYYFCFLKILFINF